MSDREPMDHAQAEALVRDALLSAVALTTSDIEQVEVPAGALLENSDVEVVALLLSRMLGAVLGVALPDSGRRLLAQIAANAVGEE